MHVFGSPVYVLEKQLADGKSIGQWQRKSERCIYLGVSDKHSGEAALVFNPETKNITVQWNVVFDDEYTTIATNPDDLPDFDEKEWSQMFGTITSHFDHNDKPMPAEQPTAAMEPIVKTQPAFEQYPSNRTRSNTTSQYMDRHENIPEPTPKEEDSTPDEIPSTQLQAPRTPPDSPNQPDERRIVTPPQPP